MAAVYNFSSDRSVAVTGKVEPPLLRLPLELRQQIYAIVLGPRRLIDLRHVQVELDPYTRFMIDRSKSEKQHERDEKYEGVDGENEEKLAESVGKLAESEEELSESVGELAESGEKLSESYFGGAYRFSEDFMYERRTGILGVSRIISNETLDILYGQNVFVVDIHGEGYRKFLKFGASNLRRVRYLRIVARPMGISYGKPLDFDSHLWLPLLEELQQLCVVAQQPLAAGGYWKAPTLEEDLCEWTTWLDPILKCLGTHLPKTTAVSLDDDGHVETTAMMHKYFNNNYQKVMTITGDFCFERGQYSRESRDWDSDYGDDGGGNDFEDWTRADWQGPPS